MANFLGRAIRFYGPGVGAGSPVTVGSPNTTTVITGLRSKTITIGGEALDITTDDTSGWQEFLSVAPRKGYTIEAAGLTKDSNILDLVDTEGIALLENYTLDFGTEVNKTVTGDWILSNLSLTAEYEGVVEFSATIASSGVMTVA